MSLSATSVFDSERILRGTSVRHVEYHPVLESTNATACELLTALVENGPALVLTASQTAGRGRKGNSWWSSTGALTFSLVLDPDSLGLSPERRLLVSLAAGLAVRDAVAALLPTRSVMVKWPNDVYVAQQKVCGILAELHSQNGQLGLIIGIGINVNNSLRDAPPEVAARAASLFDLAHQSFDLTALLIDVLQNLDRRIHQIASQPIGFLAEVNRHHMLSNRQVSLRCADTSVSGTCLGVDESGQLVLRVQDVVRRFAGGAVTSWT